MHCGRFCRFSFLEIFLCILLGAAVGVLFWFNFLSGINTAVWIVFGLAVLILIFLVAGLYAASAFRRTPLARCLACRGVLLLTATIGTLVMAIGALSITLTTTSIWVTALIAVGAFFNALMLIELILLLCCISRGLRGRFGE